MQHQQQTMATLPGFEWLGEVAYLPMWRRMRERAEGLGEGRDAEMVWACEHAPVYTTGRRGVDNRRRDDLPAPLLHTDRGGETTFHGPGQLMLYPVLDLRVRQLGVRDYVCLLEQSCIDLLADYGLMAGRRDGLPGVWFGGEKIAAIGLRVSHGVVWHGMALNVAVESFWFDAINACGAGLGVTSMAAHVEPPPLADLARAWYAILCSGLAAAAGGRAV